MVPAYDEVAGTALERARSGAPTNGTRRRSGEETTTIRRLMDRVGPGDGDISPALLDACRRGDRDALRALYEAHKDRVYSVALYFFHGDAATAADMTQQVFLKLIRQLSSYRGESAFSTWLHRIVVTTCVDRARQIRREPVATEPAALDGLTHPAVSHEDRFSQGELAQSVKDAIAVLPAKLRLAILLRYFDDLSYADMAAALNCSTGTIASRLSRAHRLLAAKLAPLRAHVPDGAAGLQARDGAAGLQARNAAAGLQARGVAAALQAGDVEAGLQARSEKE